MITLIILISAVLFIATGLAISLLALPILAILIPIGLAVSIIGILFKLVFGGPLLVLIIIWSIFYFSKPNRRRR